MNLCINWMNENNGFLMCIITAVYAGFTLFIMHFNKKSANAAKDQVATATKQINEMKRQQKQNAGISLYAIRKSVLTGFSEKQYDAVYWDAVILFSSKTADEIFNTGILYKQMQDQKKLIEEYQTQMKSNFPELYGEFVNKVDLTTKYPEDEELLNSLYSLCEDYQPVYDGPLYDGKIIMNYRELSEKMSVISHRYEAQHIKTFMLIKNELKQSIELK